MKFSVKDVNWQELNSPHKTLRRFQPTKEKLAHLYRYMLEGKLNLSDENRIPQKLDLLFTYFFAGIGKELGAFHLFYEIGNYDGLLGFTDINCTYKCNTFFKLWNKEKFTHNNVTGIKVLLDLVKKELQLKRIELSTPDESGVRLAELCGFKKEGTQKFGYIWNGKYYNNYLLRRI